MGLFVNIKSADTPASPVTANENNAMMIGKSSVIPEDNPFLAADIAKLDGYNIPITSALYKAAQNYFTHVNGNAGLWIYVVSGSSENGYEIMFEGPRDGSNDTFYSPYSPLTSFDKIECNFYGSGWYEEATGLYTIGIYDGNPDGSVTFPNGLTYIYTGEDGTGYEVSGLYPGATDYVRGDLTYGPLGKAFNSMLADNMYYQFFTFAYDQSLTQPVAGGGTKFASGQCYGGESWLDDVKIGKMMAASFYNVQKYPMFVTVVPDSMKPNTTMTGEYTIGTSYDGQRYSKIRDIIGQSKFVIVSNAKQATDGEDSAASFMGDCMSTHPRKTISTLTTSMSQVEFPKNDEVLAWKSAQVNPLLNYAGVTMWFSGKTLGVGNEQEINYNRCLGIVKKRLRDEILNRIMKRDLKYTLDGVNSLIDTINGAMKRLQVSEIIDAGPITVKIPIKSYLIRESSLNAADKAYLASVRQSQLVKEIGIKFPWGGDIVFVEIASILPN